MQFKEKELVLKNGKKAVLRSPVAKDARDMVGFLMKTAEETDFLLYYPEERNISEESEAKILDTVLRSSMDMMIACFIEGKLVGNCQISFYRTRKTAHRATLAIAILKEYWGLGIGTAMFEEMIACAKTRCIFQLELEFAEGNDRARMLYEKMGFSVVAEKPCAFRLKDGTMLKEYCMVKYL
ncbi:MAG: GNAT family N-acetyltransferase [Clostridia bacterium]|nr:GNAT family N-acetyltransferase [Clostridia bacterium]